MTPALARRKRSVFYLLSALLSWGTLPLFAGAASTSVIDDRGAPVRIIASAIDDSRGGDGDGRLEPGEQADLTVLIEGLPPGSSFVAGLTTPPPLLAREIRYQYPTVTAHLVLPESAPCNLRFDAALSLNGGADPVALPLEIWSGGPLGPPAVALGSFERAAALSTPHGFAVLGWHDATLSLMLSDSNDRPIGSSELAHGPVDDLMLADSGLTLAAAWSEPSDSGRALYLKVGDDPPRKLLESATHFVKTQLGYDASASSWVVLARDMESVHLLRVADRIVDATLPRGESIGIATGKLLVLDRDIDGLQWRAYRGEQTVETIESSRLGAPRLDLKFPAKIIPSLDPPAAIYVATDGNDSSLMLIQPGAQPAELVRVPKLRDYDVAVDGDGAQLVWLEANGSLKAMRLDSTATAEHLPATVGRATELVGVSGRRVVWFDDGTLMSRRLTRAGYCGAGSDTESTAASDAPLGPEILCNGIDDDNNPATKDAPDADLDGYDVCGPGDIVNPDGKAKDCNDTRNDVYPGALEFCDGVDNNCDVSVDEVVGQRYISPTGSDTNNLCTASGTPCRTFNNAIHAACANETVWVNEGTYNQNVVVDKAVIVDNLGLSQNTTVAGLGTDDVVKILVSGAFWDGVEVRGSAAGKACVRIGDATHQNLRNVTVGNAAFYQCGVGILAESTGNDDTLIGKNRLNQIDCRDNIVSGADTGIGLLLVGLNGRFEVAGGQVHNNQGVGVRVKAPSSGTDASVFFTGIDITGNGFNASADGHAGLEINSGTLLQVEGNNIHAQNGAVAGDDGRGLVLNNISDGIVACNRFQSNETGIAVTGTSNNLQIIHNRIASNTVKGATFAATTGSGSKINETLFTGNAAGLENLATAQLNARHNWWGQSSGPSGQGGTGDSVSGNIDIGNFIARSAEPVLTRRPMATGWGFPIAACYDTLQGAMDNAAVNGLVLVGTGQYFERATLSKVLSLEGVPAVSGQTCSAAEIYGAQGSGANRPALRVSNVTGISMKYLTIRSAGEGTAACNTHSGDEIGLDLQNVKSSTFTDICFKENGITEVRLYGDCDNNTFQRVDVDGQLCLPGNGCLCSHRSREGFLIDGAPVCEAGPGAIASGNKILDSTIHHTTRGVSLRLAATTEIATSTIDAATTPDYDSGSYAACVQIVASDDSNVHNNTIGGDTETDGVRISGKAAGQCFTEELTSERTIVRDNTIQTASGPGVYIQHAVADPGTVRSTDIRCNDMTQNSTGVLTEDVGATLQNTMTLNDIHANSTGVRGVAVDTFPASRNWWGSASGPSGAGPGTGDSVQGSVDYSAFLASSAKNDNDGDGFTECGGDCDDTKSSVKPGATEICNGIDDDCDGSVDEGLPPQTYYRDADGDGYGTPSDTKQGCVGFAPTGYVASNTDCNDNNAAIHPGVGEITCDNVDQNCNGNADETPDADGDTYDVCGPANVLNPDGKPADCNDLNPNAHPGAAEVICDGVDEACNGSTDEAPDGDGDGADRCGFSDPYNPDALAADCDDNNPNRAPNLPEICDAIDNDCDNTVDDGLPTQTYYRDADGDTYGTSATTAQACVAPAGYVANSSDCNDSNAAINPGAAEICTDNVDNDCDALIDAADTPCSGLDVTNLKFSTGSKTTMTWNTAASATSYALLRGSVTGNGMRGVYNHRDLASELSGATAQDSDLPPANSAFYYLATGLQKNATTGDIVGGPLGKRSTQVQRPESTIAPAGPRIFVNPAAVGAGNGLSWADAYTTVSAALHHTKAPSRGLEIWVKGTNNNQGSNTLSGASRAGVVLYGGFAGTETLLSQRNTTTNPTTWKGAAGATLLASTDAGVVIDGMTLDTGSNGITLSTSSGDGIELRNVTTKNFTARVVDLTSTAGSGATLFVDGSSFDALSQFGINALSQGGTITGLVRNNSFSGSSDSAIRFVADPTAAAATISVTLLRNTVSGGNRGFYLLTNADNDGFAATIDSLIGSNLIHHVTTEAIRVESSGSFSTLSAATSARNIPGIAQNSLVDSATGVLCTVSRTDTSSNVAGHTIRATPAIWDNLITNMSGAGVRESSDNAAQNLIADPTTIGNDIFACTPLYRDEGTTDLTLSQINALSGNKDNLSSDPLYVNRAGRDYHLQASSPALDKAHNSDSRVPFLPAEDFEGTARPKGSASDLGADER